MKTRFSAVVVFLALVVAFGGGLYAGLSGFGGSQAWAAGKVGVTLFGNPTQPNTVDMSQFWDAWNELEQNFVQVHASTSVPTDQEKIYGAISGLAASFKDPYTVFLPPSEAQSFNETVSGSFGGVGMELGLDEKGNLIVVAPLKGSPAEAAGVRTRDRLISIGATSTSGMSVERAVKFIRGPKGSKVELSVLHQGDTKPSIISIVRDTIQIPTVDTKQMGDVFVISLYSFSANSPDLFRNALREFFESGKTKLVLDLRGNPGGYLEAAVDMSSYFLPVGSTVVTEDYKGKRDNVVHRSLGYNVFAGKKLAMAIVVDQGSASASEILAGALQQNGVAKLVGTRTFGKGSVQQLIDLGGGAELKVTVARWLTPNKTSISDGGLTPDIKAERSETDYKAGKDPQMDAAVAWLATQ